MSSETGTQVLGPVAPPPARMIVEMAFVKGQWEEAEAVLKEAIKSEQSDTVIDEAMERQFWWHQFHDACETIAVPLVTILEGPEVVYVEDSTGAKVLRYVMPIEEDDD